MKALKSIIIILLCVLSFSVSNADVLPTAQQKAIEKSLRTQYIEVQYHPEAGGWFLLLNEKDGEMYYSMADGKGEIIASDAIDYTCYEGYIRLRIADKAKKRKHDLWKQDMVAYDLAYQQFCQVDAEYEEVLQAYNTKVQSARQKAQEKYNKMVDEAQRAAQAEQKSKASNAGGIFQGRYC